MTRGPAPRDNAVRRNAHPHAQQLPAGDPAGPRAAEGPRYHDRRGQTLLEDLEPGPADNGMDSNRLGRTGADDKAR